MYVSAAALLAMMWVDCDKVLALVVMCVAVGALGTIECGAVISEQDIAPNFAGSLKGLTNTVGSATGFLAPAITSAIIDGNVSIPVIYLGGYYNENYVVGIKTMVGS